MSDIIQGWNDVLKLGTKVKVNRTGHEAIISKVVGEPIVRHCTCYHIEPKDPKGKYDFWYFRHELKVMTS